MAFAPGQQLCKDKGATMPVMESYPYADDIAEFKGWRINGNQGEASIWLGNQIFAYCTNTLAYNQNLFQIISLTITIWERMLWGILQWKYTMDRFTFQLYFPTMVNNIHLSKYNTLCAYVCH